MRSMSLGAEEAIKHAPNVVEMLFFDVSARLEVITEDRGACTPHHAQLLAQTGLGGCEFRFACLSSAACAAMIWCSVAVSVGRFARSNRMPNA